MFATDSKGNAHQIPFQIDEINNYGDFVLDKGKRQNVKTGNQYFDGFDELSFMGEDVGELVYPKKFNVRKPNIIYEIKASTYSKGVYDKSEGGVYIGIYFQKPPEVSSKRYVVFDKDQVRTSRYQYTFDRNNYLIADDIRMVDYGDPTFKKTKPLIDSSTFYLKADLKYFLTVFANHKSVNSELESYKTGPIRTIVRVAFYYVFLKLKFEVGMYTEVSLFSNSVVLPAVISNPVDGTRILNDSSNFYYGFAFNKNPNEFKFETNMQDISNLSNSIFSIFSQSKKQRKYWASLVGEDRMMFLNLSLSKSMLDEDNIPMYYMRDKSSKELSAIDNNQINPLGKSPVNLALSFDLTKFRKGEHYLSFQMFFENRKELNLIEEFRNLHTWKYQSRRIK